jgi:hypothetical protein
MARELAHGEHEIGRLRSNGRTRHPVVGGLARILNEYETAGFFHGFDAECAIASAPRQDDGEPVPALRGERRRDGAHYQGS